MNKIERVRTVLAGRQPDRPPLSFWYHFGPDATFGPKAVEAHVRHLETYDLDFLKVMDDNRYPRPATPSGVIASARTSTNSTSSRAMRLPSTGNWNCCADWPKNIPGRSSWQPQSSTPGPPCAT